MTYEVRKSAGGWEVVNTETGEVKATHQSEEKAKNQVRLLEEIEKHGGWD